MLSARDKIVRYAVAKASSPTLRPIEALEYQAKNILFGKSHESVMVVDYLRGGIYFVAKMTYATKATSSLFIAKRSFTRDVIISLCIYFCHLRFGALTWDGLEFALYESGESRRRRSAVGDVRKKIGIYGGGARNISSGRR